MTAISFRPTLPAALRATTPALRQPAAPAPAGTATPSAVVTLSGAGLAAQAGDASVAAAPPGLRFQDLAAPMFDTLKAGGPVAIGSDVLPPDVDNRFSLAIVTASGTRVALTLASRGDELLVQVNAAAALGDSERNAVAALAEGYQDAIDGLALLGKLKSARDIPLERQLVRDLLDTLQPYRAGRPAEATSREDREEEHLQALAALEPEVLLLGSAGELTGRDARLAMDE
ncbi:hypothetical protein [Pseudoduganella chitinolytica]|uniref:Uncharacterized protein n=1 Tax=Pseudoduganella chitinolytica TaxID=34070 RepID=A0ABY8BDM7_9BURK|nr:hypothetical protein [Pseudoduganella chitinolytica]WEF34021.1 hypothetical protein PX653_04400 [Pseudoduganella chitinolytica]